VQSFSYYDLERGQVAERIFNQVTFGKPLSDFDETITESSDVKPDL
jgi:hypothetical protein